MKKILAIDDKKDNLISLKAILNNYLPECEVLLANNGIEGIKIAQENIPDTIILDLIMPEMDGYSVCKKLKENEITKHIPVIMLTAIRTDTESKVKGLDSGADAFITKPIEPNELTAQINVMLRIKSAEDELRAERERLDEMVQLRTQELIESKRKLRLFMDSATDIFTLWSKEFELLEINKLNINFIPSSLSKEKIIGKELREIFPKLSQYNEIESKLDNVNIDSIEIEDHVINESETQWFIHKVFKAGAGFGVITSNITERKLAEIELRKTQEQLRQSQKMEAYGQLAGGIAHDFNNILGTILGYSELIENYISKDDKIYGKIQNIKSAAKRAADLTKQLLAFSRKQTLQPQVIDLNEIITDLKKMLFRMIEANIDLVTEFDEELNNVLADPGQMGQIIMNLVVNGRDAMPNGGTLKIKTQNQYIDEITASSIPGMDPGEYVVIEISDTGYGMDKEIVDHIFEPFYTTKDVDQGTGLGLSVVHGIVKQSNGFIAVRSVVNSGTTFYVYFPSIIETNGTTNVTKLHRVNSELSGNESILLVEDNQELRSLAREILKAQNYNVFCAENSTEAIELIENPDNTIDLLLTDIIMPGISGIELAKKITSLSPGIKVVYISGYADGYLNKMNLPEDINPLLEKPFTMKSLLEIVRDTLDCKNPI